ncbi:chaplin [Streptomyces krungchingensis]|uniref:chaplin n=1 Tax=Streptomyces krungchingensis TaxID=1565034 RepID=UPI003CEB2DEB
MVVAAAATSIVSLYGNPAFADAGAEGVAADSPGIASGNNVQVPLNVPVNACGNTVDVIALLNPAFGNSCANGSGSHGTSGSSHVPVHHDDSVYGPGDSGYGYDDSGYGYDDSEQSVTPATYSGSSAHGESTGSPGVLSGGLFQVPLDVPVNACGNTVDVVSALNPAFGNECGYGDTPPTTPPTTPPKTTPPTTTPPTTTPPTAPPPTTTPPRTVTPPSTPPATPPPTYTPPTPASTPPPVEEQTPPPPGGSLPNTGSEGTLAASAASAALLAGGILLYRRGRAASRR